MSIEKQMRDQMPKALKSSAEFVWCNALPGGPVIPNCMGQPGPNQGVGTYFEQLAEIAGRVCYDSFGKGRSSEAFHQHIQEVGHLSILEHCTFTIEFKDWHFTRAIDLLDAVNRPGLFITKNDLFWRVTANLRTVLDWDKFGRQSHLYSALNYAASQLAPAYLDLDSLRPERLEWCKDAVRVVQPELPNEVWVTLHLTGSRGFSHELVRHGDFTAISQRSTRYVDESNASWCWHPLIQQFNDEQDTDAYLQDLERHKEGVGILYDNVVDVLQQYLINKGEDKQTARKQARGAARGLLGNALETQLIFSASLSQWRHIFSMRCSKHADMEIRNIMCEARDIVEDAANQI